MEEFKNTKIAVTSQLDAAVTCAKLMYYIQWKTSVDVLPST